METNIIIKMEKNIKRYTVTTVLEYDRDGDVVREERCEDKEYYEPEPPAIKVPNLKSDGKSFRDLMKSYT